MARLREILLPWDSQPQEVAELRGDGAIPRPKILWVGSSPRSDMASSLAVSRGAAVTDIVGVPGLGIRTANSSTGFISIGASTDVSPPGMFTVACFFKQDSSVDTFAFSTRNSSTTSVQGFEIVAGFSATPGVNRLRFRSSGAYLQSADVTGLDDGKYHMFLFGRDAADQLWYWVDGVSIQEAIGTCVGSVTSTQPLSLSRRATTYGVNDFALTAYWEGVSLDPAQRKAFSDGPWAELFAPRKILIPVSAAAGATTHATTGALTGAGSQVVGSAAHIATHATTGVLTGAGSEIVGSAARTREHPASGVLTGAGSEVVGSAAHQALHTTSGALTGQGSEIVGAAARTRAHPSSGALTGPGSQIVGAADHAVPGGVHDTSGALVGAGSSVVGSAAHIATHATSGALTGQGSAVVGSAARATGAVTHATSGALIAQGAIVAGSAARISAPVSHSTAGTLIGQGTLVIGLAFIGNALVLGSLVGSTRKTHSDRPSSTISATRRNIQTSRR